MRLISLRLVSSLLACAALVGAGRAAESVEIATVAPSGVRADSLPAKVAGLTRQGSVVRASVVSLKNRAGDLRAEAFPAVAVVQGARWSPNDAEREGAGEFEVLICAARLLDQRALAGIVGVGNRNGFFLPSAETAFQRIVRMGLPVVRLSRGSNVAADADNLFIEGGSLSAENARQLLAVCLLRHGSLPPVADAEKPTDAELVAIKAKLALFQREFDLAAGPSVAMR